MSDAVREAANRLRVMPTDETPHNMIADARLVALSWLMQNQGPGAPRMSDAQKTIMAYLNRSAGNANHVSEHTFRCFLGMIEGGEATLEDMRECGGEYVVEGIRDIAKKLELPVPGDTSA